MKGAESQELKQSHKNVCKQNSQYKQSGQDNQTENQGICFKYVKKKRERLLNKK